MRKCNSCRKQEKLHTGKLVCKHIQSIKGLEAVQEYVLCDSITECEYYCESKEKHLLLQSQIRDMLLSMKKPFSTAQAIEAMRKAGIEDDTLVLNVLGELCELGKVNYHRP